MPAWQDASKVVAQTREEFASFEAAVTSAFDKLNVLRRTASEMVEQCAALDQVIARLGADRTAAEQSLAARQGQIEQELVQQRAARLGEIEAAIGQARSKFEAEVARFTQARQLAQEQMKKAEMDRDARLASVEKEAQEARARIPEIHVQVRIAQEAFDVTKQQIATATDQLRANYAKLDSELKDRLAQRQKETDQVERKLADLRAVAKELAKIG